MTAGHEAAAGGADPGPVVRRYYAAMSAPFLIDVGASDLIVNRGLKNTFRIKPGFGACVDQGIALLGSLNKAANGVAKTAVIVHESGEFGTGTAKLLASKLPSIGIEAKELIAHDNPTRNFDNIALRIRSVAPDIVMMSNYQNEYMLLARTLYQQKVNVAGFYSILGGGFNYKFAKEQPEVSQYMMDTNHWYNPKSAQAQALKKRVEAAGKEFTFEVYLAYTVVGLLADHYGVDTVFGIPGVHNIELYRGLHRFGVRAVSPRHEQGAGFMADGWSVVTGRPARMEIGERWSSGYAQMFCWTVNLEKASRLRSRRCQGSPHPPRERQGR